MQAELLTLGWTLSFAALCYELRSLKKFISLDLHPVYFLLEGPPSHQLLSQGAKAIRQQWKRNTTVFTFNSLGLMPWTSYEICCEDGYKNMSDWQKSRESPCQGAGMAVSRAHLLAGPIQENVPWVTLWDITGLLWASLGWPRAGAAAKLHQSQVYTRKWRSYEVLPWPKSWYFYVLQGCLLTGCEKRARKPQISACSWISLRSCFYVLK